MTKKPLPIFLYPPGQEAPALPAPPHFHLRRVVSGLRCYRLHDSLWQILPTGQEAEEVLNGWHLWCSECQAVALSEPEAVRALGEMTEQLAGLSPEERTKNGPVGVIASAPLALKIIGQVADPNGGTFIEAELVGGEMMGVQ